MIWCVFFLMTNLNSQEDLVAQHKYLDAAVVMRKNILDHPDPVLIRKYTVLIIENYVSQIGFRVFFLANLSPSESPLLARNRDDSLVSDGDRNVAEQNLEELLVLSRKRFPKSLDIEFAVAFYVYMGRCCIAAPRIHMDQEAIIDVFRRADEKGIFAGRSLYALAQAEKQRENPRKKRIVDWYRRAFEAAPDDLDIAAAYLEYLLEIREFETARDVAQRILGRSRVVEQRLVGLHGAAQAFLGLRDYPRALKAVDLALTLVPEHVFVWMIGLDALRQQKDSQAYSDLVMRFVQVDSEDPGLFALYVAYLRDHEITDLDRFFIHEYADTEPETELGRITKLLNLASFAMEESEFDRALSLLRDARARTVALSGDHAALLDVLDHWIANAEKNAN